MIFRPVAKQEIDDIVTYYESQKKGLGFLFLNVFDLHIKRIDLQPLQFPIKHKNIRAATLQDFPYTIFFRSYKGQIIILAVIHHKRNPKLWLGRK